MLQRRRISRKIESIPARDKRPQRAVPMLFNFATMPQKQLFARTAKHSAIRCHTTGELVPLLRPADRPARRDLWRFGPFSGASGPAASAGKLAGVWQMASGTRKAQVVGCSRCQFADNNEIRARQTDWRPASARVAPSSPPSGR